MTRPDFEHTVHADRTFMGAARSPSPTSMAAVVGVPFDCGSDPVRSAIAAPESIRRQSALLRRFCPPAFDYDPTERLQLVDCGDVDMDANGLEQSFDAIQTTLAAVVERGLVPITMGGDGSVTLPQLRALRGFHPDLALLHVDAHTDCYPLEGSHANATTFTHAAMEGLLDVAHAIHLGVRGPTDPAGVYTHTRAYGYEVIDGDTLFRQGVEVTMDYVVRRLASRPLYVCFDMDFFDPACAPGVVAPVWGGASAREGLAVLSALKALDVVAFDINTVCPPQDVNGMTATLAARVMLEVLFMLSHRRFGDD